MFRKSQRKETQRTKPDHRPMIPELRKPADPVAEAVREIHRRYDDMIPAEFPKWR